MRLWHAGHDGRRLWNGGHENPQNHRERSIYCTWVYQNLAEILVQTTPATVHKIGIIIRHKVALSEELIYIILKVLNAVQFINKNNKRI